MISVEFSRAGFAVVLLGALSVAVDASAADWPTARGNPQRTGCVDGKAGPEQPKVAWVLKSQDHFIAAPVPHGDRLYVAGANVFNVASVMALPLVPKADPAALWTRSTPLLKLAVVSSPACADGKVIFGDGMHQDSAGTLYCLNSAGRPIWQLRLPGELIHMEGAPTIAGQRVYIGGGNAGVLCVERDRATLDGKELDDAAIQKLLDEKWKELQARYQEEKRKDPDTAVPPNEDQLPKAAPVRVWQQGAGKWHVDAPVVVVGERVLVCSAFLDREKSGDRALFCLDAKDGKVLWRRPVPMNPWSGASVQGDLVVVAGSTVNYDPEALKGARGFIAAFDLQSGAPKWQKDVQGGVVGNVALTDSLAVACATDGKVRAFDLASGERRWIFDAKTPLFAPPAIAGGVAYVGDLKGALRAITLADGKQKWALELGAEPAVKAPGMIYGGPVLHGGRLYVATCNLKGTAAGQPTVVVCIESK
jgi:outer membrane protein assembly factor BamB